MQIKQCFTLTAVNTYILKKKISNQLLTPKFNKLEKEMQTKPKASQREEIINTKVEINEKENRKSIEKSINQNLLFFFYKINKTDRQRTRKKKEGLNYKIINE